jgi:hypothetical protein
MQYQPGRQPQRRSSWIGYLIILLLILAICGVIGSTFYRQQFDNLLRNLEPSCSISAFGATITVQGWSANNDCQQMLYGGDNFTGVNWSGATSASVVDGSVICEQDIDGRHVIVRDNGANSGAVVCGMLNPILPRQ